MDALPKHATEVVPWGDFCARSMGILCYAYFIPRAGLVQWSWAEVSALDGEQLAWWRGHKAETVLKGQLAHCCSGN